MNRFTLAVIGGAAGVGKTTLLDRIPGLERLSTGTFFKERMSLASRDDVRAGDWSVHEAGVCSDLVEAITQKFATSPAVILDTHFSAKLNGRNFRIGLREPLLFDLAAAVIRLGHSRNTEVRLLVALVDCDPYALLDRRRKDRSRNRELVPSDCYNSLRENRTCSSRYVSEFRRAAKAAGVDGAQIEYSVVENCSLEQASADLSRRLLGSDS